MKSNQNQDFGLKEIILDLLNDDGRWSGLLVILFIVGFVTLVILAEFGYIERPSGK